MRIHRIRYRLVFATAVVLGACRTAEPLASTPHVTSTSPADPRPTYDHPPTREFPTPEPTPARWPTPEIPDEDPIDQELELPNTSVQTLDVYWPESGGDWPIIVLLHGGDVDKRSVRKLAMRVAGHGAVVFTPNYQSSEALPDGIARGAEEAACAVRFARIHGAEYGGDPGPVIIVGHSGGGAFGAFVALAGDQFHGDCRVAEGDTTSEMLIALDGAFDLPRYTSEALLREAPAEDWLKASPYSYIESAPSGTRLSFHFFVGLETELLRDAQALRDALVRAGYLVTLTQFPGIDHMRMASGSHASTVWAIVTLMGQ
jgi:acetyl esterase/lipase